MFVPPQPKDNGTRSWWRTNQGVGVVLSVALAILLVYLLLSDWVYKDLRDGFKLGFFPLGGVIATLFCALVLIIDTHRHEVEEDLEGIDWRSWLYCVILLIGCYVYFEFAQAIGFLTASPIFLLGFIYLLGVRPWTSALVAGVIMTALVYGVFTIFGVPMP
jgi:putative tricarboxylic transport membrane protein